MRRTKRRGMRERERIDKNKECVWEENRVKNERDVEKVYKAK